MGERRPLELEPHQLMNRLEDPNYLLVNPLSNKQMHLFLVGYNVNGLAGRATGIGTPNGWGGGPGNNHLFSEARPIQPMKFKKLLLAHETGHLIGGTHGNAVKFGCSPFPVCGRSLMNHNIWLNQMYFFSNANDTRVSSVSTPCCRSSRGPPTTTRVGRCTCPAEDVPAWSNHAPAIGDSVADASSFAAGLGAPQMLQGDLGRRALPSP